VPGFVKVTGESLDRSVLQPLGADEPRRTGIANQASLYTYAPKARKVHTGGGCDLGDWVMPFKIRLSKWMP
jgi:hypothetical protein